ncbi:MAG: D-amino acid dehydrogenase [Magnetospiraceae bacterium]
MRVLVLGAGVVGVATAYFLSRAGHAVTVLDRQPGPSLETSYANGGQLSCSHVTPWSTPGNIWNALKWIGREDAPLLLHPRFDLPLARWLSRFVVNACPRRVRAHTERALRIALYSREVMAELQADTRLHYDQRAQGILHFFRSGKAFEKARENARIMVDHGLHIRMVATEELVSLEPAFAAAAPRLVGGCFTPGDGSGNARRFTEGLAKVAAAAGVTFRYECPITALRAANGKMTGVETARGVETADAYVLAAGSYSVPLAQGIGLPLPIYPAKGYSISIPVTAPEKTPEVSLIDDEHKIVFSRLGEVLRVAGTAEFDGWNTAIRPRRAAFLGGIAQEMFPGCGDFTHVDPWAGLRPQTPDSVPILGASPIQGLWLNTGHGTLGWTMAAGSGRLLADLISGKQPAIDMTGLTLDRF